jgi:hypothetical protein
VAPVDLAQRSLPGTRIAVNVVIMHVADQGAGTEVVLLVHGMPGTSACWKYQVPELVKAGYLVVARPGRQRPVRQARSAGPLRQRRCCVRGNRRGAARLAA